MNVVWIVALFAVVAVSAQPASVGLGLTAEQRQSALEAAKQAKAAGTSVQAALQAWASANLTPEQQQTVAAKKDQIEAFLTTHNLGKRATLGDGQRLAQVQAKVDQLKATATPEQLENAAAAKQNFLDKLAARGYTGEKIAQAKTLYEQGQTPAQIYQALSV